LHRRSEVGVAADTLRTLRREVRDQLRVRIDARGLASAPPAERRVRVRDEALDLLRQRGALLPQRELNRIVNEVSDDVVGFGPIESLLKDPTVTEVMVNGPDDVFVEREGRIERVRDRLFEGEEPVMHLIERIVGPLGLRVDHASPWVDARLPDGSRVHAIVPPLSLRGPTLTIRKFSPAPITPDLLVERASIGPRMMRFLLSCVRGRANMVVSGGAGSGKTTMLGILTTAIRDDERVITIEDAAELRLANPHVVSLEARPANVEGRGEVSVRDLVRNALRMRPDRIIVGEVRGPEAFDMLQEMNTGHNGSMSTIHANSARDALARVENMVMMANVNLPSRAIHGQMVSALDLIVQIERMRDGTRRVTEVSEVVGMEQDIITLGTLFAFKYEGQNPDGTVTGRFEATGLRPRFLPRLEYYGLAATFMKVVRATGAAT
jgi:pilus assembly protein CpaF